VRYVEGSTNAYVSVRVAGKDLSALIDTGSELSLAPASLVHNKDLRRSDQVLRAANGTTIHILGETTLHCEISGMSFEVPCLVTEQLTELILGLEWLERHGASWNFAERTIKIRDQIVPLQKVRPRNKNYCRRIALAEKRQVPPLSEMNIPFYETLPKLNCLDEEKLWATQPQLLASGLLVAGNLRPDQTMDLMVPVLNLSIPKGVQRKIEEVSVVEESEPSGPSSVCSSVKEEFDCEPSEVAEKVLAPLCEGVPDDVPAEVRDRLRTVLKNADALSCQPQRVDMVRSAAVGRTSKDSLTLEWNPEIIRKEPSEGPALSWILNKKPESEMKPTYDEVRPLCEEGKSLVAQWQQLRVNDGVLYRSTEQESTGCTACKLLLGREVNLPIDLVLRECLPVSANVVHFVTEQETVIKTAFAEVREFSQRLANVRASRYNLRVRPAVFKPGDWVWLYYPRRRPKIKEKWAKYFVGPVKILEQLSPVLFKVQKSKRAQPQLVHIDKLKPFEGKPPGDWEPKEMDPVGDLEFENLEGLGEENPHREERVDIPPQRPRREITVPLRFRE